MADETPQAPAPAGGDDGDLGGQLPDGFSLSKPVPDGAPPVAVEPEPDAAPPAAAEPAEPQGEPAKEPSEDELLAKADPKVRAILDRRERQQIEREAMLRAQEATIREHMQLREAARTNPLEAARMLGLGPIELAEAYLGAGQPGEKPQQGGGEVEQLKAQLAQLQQRLDGQETAQAVSAEHRRLRTMITGAAEQYPMLAAMTEEGDAAIQEAFDMARQQYAEASRRLGRNAPLPDFGRILGALEQQYTANVFGSLQALKKLPAFESKLRELLGERPPAPSKTTPKGPKTLTSADSAAEPHREDRELDDAELDRMAIEALRRGPPKE